MRILIVDDDLEICQQLNRSLLRQNYQTDTSADGDSLPKAKRGNPADYTLTTD